MNLNRNSSLYNFIGVESKKIFGYTKTDILIIIGKYLLCIPDKSDSGLTENKIKELDSPIDVLHFWIDRTWPEPTIGTLITALKNASQDNNITDEQKKEIEKYITEIEKLI